MRPLILLTALVGMGLIDAQHVAKAAPYCFEWEGQTDCAYYTLRQCLATKRGVGGRCHENLFMTRAQPYGSRRQPGNCTVYLRHGRWGRCR